MKLEFTVEQLRVLDEALQKMPYYLSAPIINSINAQLQAVHDERTDMNDMPSGASAPL